MRRVASTPSTSGIGDVHEDHVGLELVGQAHRLVAVARLAHDLEALFGHRTAQPLAQHPMVVGQHQADGHNEVLRSGFMQRRADIAPPYRALRQPMISMVAPMLAARSRMPRIP